MFRDSVAYLLSVAGGQLSYQFDHLPRKANGLVDRLEPRVRFQPLIFGSYVIRRPNVDHMASRSTKSIHPH